MFTRNFYCTNSSISCRTLTLRPNEEPTIKLYVKTDNPNSICFTVRRPMGLAANCREFILDYGEKKEDEKNEYERVLVEWGSSHLKIFGTASATKEFGPNYVDVELIEDKCTAIGCPQSAIVPPIKASYHESGRAYVTAIFSNTINHAEVPQNAPIEINFIWASARRADSEFLSRRFILDYEGNKEDEKNEYERVLVEWGRLDLMIYGNGRSVTREFGRNYVDVELIEDKCTAIGCPQSAIVPPIKASYDESGRAYVTATFCNTINHAEVPQNASIEINFVSALNCFICSAVLFEILDNAVINIKPYEDSTRTAQHQAVDVCLLRRLNQAIWLLDTSAREAAIRIIKTVSECLADELINAAKCSSNS
uniref:Small ribosomal subunit protein uS7 domain-containing protein n=1 Tax=Ditylenchus dipsaci TaxID=166011 RepID=A0A915ERN1_9BILA